MVLDTYSTCLQHQGAARDEYCEDRHTGCYCYCRCHVPGGGSEVYPCRQSSSGSASKRQFPSSATLFAGEPLRGVSASSSAFDLQEPAAAAAGHAASAAVTGRFNTYSPGEWASKCVKRQRGVTKACVMLVQDATVSWISYYSRWRKLVLASESQRATPFLSGIQWWMQKGWSQASCDWLVIVFPSELWHGWLGHRKDIWPVLIL